MFVEKLKNYFELISVANEKAYTFKKTFDNGCYAEIVLIGPLERRNIRFWYFAELNVYDEEGERNPDCFRKGYASEAMSELLKTADDVDERLELSAYPQDDVLSLEDLMNFYKDNMFKVRYGQEMYRDPLEEKKKRKKRKKAGTESSKESSLRDWFKRKGAKGKKGGWVDCNAPDGKGGYKSCGRSSGEKRKKYPSCRPTPGACKEKGRGKSWGKKGSKKRGRKKRNESMLMTDEEIRTIILEELQNVLDEKKGKKRVRKKKAKKKAKRDACYHKVRSRYDVWPSAYASGALVKCRKVGAANWGNKSKKNEELEMSEEEKQELREIIGESTIEEAEYRGRKVKLNKPMRGDVKKFKVYVKDPKTGNIKKVNFGHGGTSAKKRGEKTMKIKKSNPKRRKSFRARHNCDNPGPKTKARYWSCRKW